MLKEYLEEYLYKDMVERTKKNAKSESQLKRDLEYSERERKNKKPTMCVRKKGLSNFYPLILDGWPEIATGLWYSFQLNHLDIWNKFYVHYPLTFILKIFDRIVYKIQDLWMWRNNLEPYNLRYHLEGCEEIIDENGVPCLFHRTPPRTGKLKRIWNKLTFGVNDD